MSTLKNRLNKLEKSIMTSSNYESILNHHSIETETYPRSLDKALLIDTSIALQVKDCRGHKLGTKARDFLSWAATSNLNLIDRAYNLIEEQINAGYVSTRPQPLDLATLGTSPRVPPYAFLCKTEQLYECKNKPFWVAE